MVNDIHHTGLLRASPVLADDACVEWEVWKCYADKFTFRRMYVYLHKT